MNFVTFSERVQDVVVGLYSETCSHPVVIRSRVLRRVIEVSLLPLLGLVKPGTRLLSSGFSLLIFKYQAFLLPVFAFIVAFDIRCNWSHGVLMCAVCDRSL